MITKALFIFKDEEWKKYEKEENYTGEIENIKMLEERAFKWMEKEDFISGEWTHRNCLVRYYRKLLTFEHGALYIDVWANQIPFSS